MKETGEEWYGEEAATFGDRVEAARDALGWSQKELAGRMGVKAKTVRGWEEDLSEPRANKLQMLAGMLGVSMRWLLSGVGAGVAAPGSEPKEVTGADLAGLLAEVGAVRGEMTAQTARLERLEARIATLLEAAK
ncbi:helix-turn-helix transcriptional regulator [Vannielia sp.]|uniref:helix-turn-helix domain-containing protein n=1 Tax=Vannielia sp. TaxID=2813045 RepID=UPI002601F360|nr:helix-turn-helix transcriptional regulator [Vannielia sp.]MDF1871473.1 helix-turn-helix transcriptional regulator [Vannielia sp.]